MFRVGKGKRPVLLLNHGRGACVSGGNRQDTGRPHTRLVRCRGGGMVVSSIRGNNQKNEVEIITCWGAPDDS